MQLKSRRRPDRPASDEGFTLMELVVAVAILGIIIVPLFGVVLAYLKNSTATASRLGESTDQQFVSVYWQNDVSSIGNRALDASSTTDPAPTSQSVVKSPTTGCGTTVGSNVRVRLEWSQFNVGTNTAQAWTSTKQEVAYVAIPQGTQFVLRRVRCSGGSLVSNVPVARSLAAPPEVQCDGSLTCPTDGSLPQKMTIKLEVRNTSDPRSKGYTSILTADRRQG